MVYAPCQPTMRRIWNVSWHHMMWGNCFALRWCQWQTVGFVPTIFTRDHSIPQQLGDQTQCKSLVIFGICALHFMHFIWGLLTIMTAAFISYNLLASCLPLIFGRSNFDQGEVWWCWNGWHVDSLGFVEGLEWANPQKTLFFSRHCISRLVQNNDVFFSSFFTQTPPQNMSSYCGNHWISYLAIIGFLIAWHKTTHPNAYCKYGLDDEFPAAPLGLAEEFEGETMSDNYIHGSPRCGVFKW